ncbi:cysteine-rich receptor-like protein kinase 43 [Lotus japonicus]|uniref:cysteine-rich receptor-like protein kinase 43 n=1 Tax=Lotus japonicus TaxID=34305 RepID=UPI00258FB21C|nr:cysteine-rich receptor-like protein kinase 43 [Lotus japonicus]
MNIALYEYYPRGNIHDIIFSTDNKLNWELKLPIIKGIASGLNYLHHELEFGALLHMDIKLANVLLDANFIPKISDFGLGLVFSHCNSSPIVAKKGIVGIETYIVPEVKFGVLSSKADVYSFGYVPFELITERVTDGANLTNLHKALKLGYEGQYFELPLPELPYTDDSAVADQMDQCLTLAVACMIIKIH